MNPLSLPLINVNSAHCAMRVQQAIGTVPGLGHARVDLPTHRALIADAASALDVREAVLRVRNAGYDVQTDQYTLNTTGITCAGCANKAGTILNGLRGVVSARVDHVTNTAEIEVVSGMLTFEDLLAALRPAGYGLVREAA
ncbi:MAG TPA: cation transporter [Flavobacteriales bacterium]|nr:cation transporter [Flavobacteriales bacterium]MCB0787131.1 cation transporter [Flavobacteriales bacterium]MCB0814504.1 cation transporter [Flavobacteriales bacterium]MCB9179649.1 cation transporter [Flavobacteriales bacterium]HOP45129.1 cation transporter [Flavobacteriales bacterium]